MSWPAPLLITLGDPAGIGPELVARAHLTGHLHDAVLVGEPSVFERGLRACAAGPGVGEEGRSVRTQPVFIKPETVVLDPVQRDEPSLPVPPSPRPSAGAPMQPHDWAGLPFGAVDARCGAYSARCLNAAVELVRRGQGRAIVTAPIHKESLAAAGLSFPGHTEMLQAWAQPSGPAPQVRMMLANEELRVVLVTTHQSLRSAIEAITYERVLTTITITQVALKAWGLERPRIAVAGLNPHAGEGGLFGREEIEVIAPAIAAAQAMGILADGPHPPDTVFMRARHSPQRSGAYDAVVAMTHDQGLIPVKYLGVEHGVNITLGLPFVRTSPDHGTAFDIAGRGVADPSSFLAAVLMARRLTGTA
ncbi:MAG: 4-hydroxythreonine-4-phosphate dehydrogenase PdxA [Betaproteobacteria bacterium]|nr:4-hydroxythreonine-4-phosphate dehydrogenase PdxA [Betaproteobacteria bacterium]